MKRFKLLMYFLFLFVSIANASMTKKEAEKYAIEFIKKKIGYKLDSISVKQTKEMMTRVDIFPDDNLFTSEPSWIFFVDPFPQLRWGHTCKYIIISPKKKEIKVITKEWAPSNPNEWDKIIDFKRDYNINLRSTFNNGHFDPMTHLLIPGMYSNIKTSTIKSNGYAILISGGVMPLMNTQSFWNETCLVYQALTDLHGFKKENVETYISDGTDPGLDILGELSSPSDLDGDGECDINGAAYYQNINSAFERLAKKVTLNDDVFIYMVSHGTSEEFWLYGTSISSSQVSSYLDKINAKSITIFISSCYSGSFVDDLRGSKRTIVTSTSSYEAGWGGDLDSFFNPFLSALGGLTYRDEIVNCDMNNDGKNDYEESFVYAIKKNKDTHIEELNTDYHVTPFFWTSTPITHSIDITAGSGRIMSGATLTTNNKISNADIVYQASNKVLLKGGFKYKQSGKAKFKCIAGGDCLRKLDILPEIEDEIFELEDFFEFNPEISDIDDVISEAEKISIYPNPTDGVLNISISNGSIDNIVVSDITGKVLVEKAVNADQAEIDLSSYNKGIYLVKVVTENDSYIEKVVLK